MLKARRGLPPGIRYDPHFVGTRDREELLAWISTLHPIWEYRYSANNPPPEGREQRRLLRPVYWLGSWQFACLDYYRPPKGTANRCVRAEPFPPVLARMVVRIEAITRRTFREADVPKGWHLNVCLVNFYGNRIEDGRRIDTARVGEHKDFEPGPVASISLGARALFQFVSSRKPGHLERVVLQQWLDDGSLQVFGGPKWKSHVFHRVQRVDRKGPVLPARVEDFETRRINFTLRYVPDEHVVPFRKLPAPAREDVRGYLETLAAHSDFFASELAGTE